MCPYFHVLGRQFTVYGLLMVIGMAVALLVTILISSRFSIMREDALYIVLLGCAGGIVGAHLLSHIISIPKYIRVLKEKPEIFWDVLLNGGLIFWGGFIGGLIFILLFNRRFKINNLNTLNMLSGPLALAHGFGRLGCLSAGCCYGKPIEGGIVFHNSPAAPNGVPLIPTQLIEAIFNFLLFLVLIILSGNRRIRHYLAHIYLFAYPIFRFFIEFFRGDVIRGFLWGLSTSQWISLAALIANSLWLSRRIKRLRREQQA